MNGDANSESLLPQMRLLDFRWNAGRQISLQFFPGLTIVHGRTQADRTTILRLVRYAFGSGSNRIDDNIMRASENVELDFVANGNLISVDRSCQTPTGAFRVYDSLHGYNFVKRDMSQFLLGKLDLPQVLLKRTMKGKIIDVPIGFYDIERAIVVDRDISYSDILSEVPSSSRKETIRILLGLTTKEIADVENRVRVLESQKLSLEQEISAVRTFLASLNVPTIPEIEEQQSSLAARLAEINAEENVTRQRIRSKSEQQADMVEKIQYSDLRQELIERRNTFDSNSRELSNLRNQVQEKLELKGVLEGEARKVTRHLAAKHVVSTFSFSQCPRCQQEISDQMYLREAEGNCFLCNRPFGADDQDAAAWQKALRDIQQTITEVNQLIKSYQERISNIEKETPELSSRIERLENILQSQTAEYVSPFVEFVSIRNEEKIDIEKSISRLQYQQTERQHANNLETERLPDVESQLERITTELNMLRSEIGTEHERYAALVHHYRHFMNNVDTVQHISSISWNVDDQLPIINDQSYKKALSGPDLALGVLGYHYALLAVSVRAPSIKSNHPKLLIIDEPEQQKMGKNRYQQVMNLFGNLALEFQDQIQIVIATDTSDIPDRYLDFAVSI